MAITALLAQMSCSSIERNAASQSDDLKPALAAITAGDLLRHITILSSDKFEGRAPGTHGEALTVEYLVQQFKKIDLSPGNPDGTYVQDVPLAAIKGDPEASFTHKKRTVRLKYPEDYVAVSRHGRLEIKVENSEIVFVGYGAVAPEFGWDDFKGIDVKGKTLLFLVNDPPVPDPSDPSKLDPKVFGGKTMTYYGRWTYKFEVAARMGAAAAIIVHEAGPAGYPYGVLVRSWGRENFTIEKSGSRENRVPVEAWITTAAARKLLALSGRNFEVMKKTAARKNFKPVSISVRASFSVRNTVRRIRSQNVIARLDGSDPKLKSEYVIYSAHWDHLGRNPNLKGDQIYNGALDNASGTAGLLEIAQAYGRMKVRPRRTILFLAFTGEEKGLLGSEYYTENPLYPLAGSRADINMDCLNPWGRTRDIVAIGLDSSPLHQVAREAAKSQGRRVEPDPEPEKGFLYRSDQFAFVKHGVPALYTDAGYDLIGKPAEYGKRKRDAYTRRDYHKVTDEVKPDWDLAGAVEDLQFLFIVGYRVAGN
jgi:Zn-dependent M28 family amino/carboxypeptidase